MDGEYLTFDTEEYLKRKTMHHIINDLSVHYETFGNPDGLPVVFIHGFPFSGDMWQPQVEDLQEFRLVTYDVRGHGHTEVSDGQYTLEYFVDDLIGLLEHLNIRRTVAVGLSMGGYIALRAVERHPDRFRGLVLCDTRSEADTNDVKVRRASQAKMVKREGVKEFTAGFLTGVFSPESFKHHPREVELIRKIIQRTDPLAIAGTLIGLAARTDTTASLPKIRIPTLILVGEHDTIATPENAKAMRERIPAAELHIIRGAAHLSNLENTEEFNSFLRKFLRKL